MELGVMYNLSPVMCVQLFHSAYNPLIPRHGFLLRFFTPFPWVKVH